MIKNKISEIIKEALTKTVEARSLGNLTELKAEITNKIIIEKTKKPEFGDYSCNVSFIAREAKIPPPKIAENIIEHIDIKYKDYFKTSIIAGFINFSLTPNWLNDIIYEILNKTTKYGKSNQGNNLKVLLEYVSANPTGPLHIGHGRWAALGSCIENILNFLNYDVKTEFYINDAGVQINNLGHSVFLRILQENDPDVYFPLDKETDPRAGNLYPGDYIIELAKEYIQKHPDHIEKLKEQATLDENLYIPDKETLTKLSDFAKAINLEKQKELLARFKTHFEIWYPESSLHDSKKVENILDYLNEKGVLYEKDGAIWFASSKFLDNQDRVIKKSDGSLTYLTADIAYHKDKLDRGFEHLINIWGADHHGYVPRMKSAIEAIGYTPDTLEVIIGQMVNLIIAGDHVRMGKRKKMFTLEDLIDDVGVDATRFWMVSRSTDSTLDFDVELAKSTSDENPVYYVQYAHARCCSILRTATSERLDIENNQKLPALYTQEKLNEAIENIKNNPELLSILWQNDLEKENIVSKSLVLNLESFKDILIKAGRDKAPHYIARYLMDLSSCFHSFYAECRVLSLSPASAMPEELQNARLALINSTKQILFNGLNLLGVNAPESM